MKAKQYGSRTVLSWLAAVTVLANACNRNSGLWNVGTPVDEVTGTALESPTGAYQGFVAAEGQYETSLIGEGSNSVFFYNSLLSDELTAAALYNPADNTVSARYAGATINGFYYELGDIPIRSLLQARSVLLLVIPELETYESGANLASVGKAFALMGYSEVLMAEDYCAGVTLDHALVDGGVVFEPALSTDSLLGVAAVHFDSALHYAAGNDTVTYLADVGLGRALLDRGQYALASTAVTNVPVGFAYMLTGGRGGDGLSNYFDYPYGKISSTASGDYVSSFDIGNVKGGNGVNFISAKDPRLSFDSMDYATRDSVYAYVLAATDTIPIQSKLYAPVKFGIPIGTLETWPLATGVEAKLITAEAALHTQSFTTVVDTLNMLRASAQNTYLQLDSAVHQLPADSTDTLSATSQVALLFRERAFWLFGLGNRVGDLRREITQDGFSADQVFPTGAYSAGLHVIQPGSGPTALPPFTTYGTAVSLTLPTLAGGYTSANPAYKSCTTSVTDPTL